MDAVPARGLSGRSGHRTGLLLQRFISTRTLDIFSFHEKMMKIQSLQKNKTKPRRLSAADPAHWVELAAVQLASPRGQRVAPISSQLIDMDP